MVRSLAVALPYYFGGLHNLQSMLLPKKLGGFTSLKIRDYFYQDITYFTTFKVGTILKHF